MSNYAIVIGINKYDNVTDDKPFPNLKGCVNDAKNMKEWLLKTDGGNVPKNNLFLLLSDENIPNDENIPKPTTNQISNTIRKVKSFSEGGNADKLFFYYAGHGFCNRGPGIEENVIMPVDYDDENKSTTTHVIDSIVKYCAGLGFKEEIFFFDSCRNFPSRQYFKVNYFDVAPPKNPSLKQHVFYATSLGSVANEANLDGVSGGLFTNALLKGLKGEQNAKFYDVTTDKYLVQGDRLLKFIKKEVSKNLRNSNGVNYDPDLFGNPILATFNGNQFPDVDLRINIEPVAAAQNVKIDIVGGRKVEGPEYQGSTVTLKLKQSDYGIYAISNGYEPNKKPYGIELYSPDSIKITMNPHTTHPKSESNQGKIIIIGKDSSALLELRDADKTILERGSGKIECNLKEGLYYARIKNDNFENEELITIRGGEEITKTLEFPETANKFEEYGGTSPPSGVVGFVPPHIASIGTNRSLPPMLEEEVRNHNMTTVIALASRMKPYEPSMDIGFLNPLISMNSTGLQVIILNESKESFSNKNIVVWSQKNSESKFVLELKEFEKEKRLSQATHELEPGHYWLSLESETELPVIFSIVIPYNSLSIFILHIDRNSKSRIFQYLPLFNPKDHGVPFENEVSNIRKLDIVQKYYQSDIQNYVYIDAMKLSYGKWFDPMAGLIAGNLMLRNRGEDEERSLEAITENMTNHFSDIPDSGVLLGRYLAPTDTERSKQSFLTAIEKGVPIFTENLEVLYESIKKFNFDVTSSDVKMIKKVFENRIRGSLWTCYTPPK